MPYSCNSKCPRSEDGGCRLKGRRRRDRSWIHWPHWQHLLILPSGATSEQMGHSRVTAVASVASVSTSMSQVGPPRSPESPSSRCARPVPHVLYTMKHIYIVIIECDTQQHAIISCFLPYIPATSCACMPCFDRNTWSKFDDEDEPFLIANQPTIDIWQCMTQ